MIETNLNTDTEIASHWLQQFSRAVRERDYEGGRLLFAPDVFAFGTYSPVIEGLDALETRQWCHIWDATRNFSFDLSSLSCGGDKNLIWIAVLWQSEGQNSMGEWFDRHGRASFVLAHREGKWLAVHSHHSLHPVLNSSFPVGGLG